MPHLRKRFLESSIKKDLTWSRVVSVLGMRQSGKTTLLRQIAQEYITLDHPETIAAFNKGDWTALEAHHAPLTIDEAQLCPLLFPQIKMRADEISKPGRYILTGSVRFLSKKQIKESLTGRTSILELLPMTLAETHSRSLNDLIGIALQKSKQNLMKTLSQRSWTSQSQLLYFLENGGMPGICFKRDITIKKRAWSAHLDTVLSRDIHHLINTKISLKTLRDLFEEVAKAQGDPINQAQLARRIGVSSPTVSQLLSAFEGLFLIRQHGQGYFCEDPGLATFAAGGVNGIQPRGNLLRLIYFEINAQIRYLYAPGSKLGEYRTRGGAYVPFVIDLPDKGKVGIGVDPASRTSDKTLRSLTFFAKANPGAHTLAIHQGKEGYLSPRANIPCIPWSWVF